MNEVTVKLREYYFWSPMLGEDAVRFSVFDERGHEFFVIRAVNAGGKRLREMRQSVADLIFDEMQSGRDPGEVN